LEPVKKLEEIVMSWPEISCHPHQFSAREFRFKKAEVGHVHDGGMVDIPFPRTVHDALLEEGLAEEHPWVPDSGWVTFRIRTDRDVQHAVWLMRLSYFRYALKAAADPAQLLAEAKEELQLSHRFEALLRQFLPATSKREVVEPLSAT
jgi:Family of unknown function (DUF5519)